MTSKTFCVMPWIHLHGWPDGAAYLCCIANNGKDAKVGDLSKNSIAEIMNNDIMKQTRKKMLAGESCSQCTNCYDMEKYKGHSWRNNNNRDFQDIIPDLIANTAEDGTIEPKQLYVDFRFSNLCNLECRSCCADLSSSIASTKGRNFREVEIKHHKEKNVFTTGNIVSFTNARNNFIEDDLKQYLKDTRCFYFAGGESLLQKEHFDILTYLDENKMYDKELRYNTNLSNLKYKGTDLVEIWSRFNNVWMMCSIDHFGDKLEYLRQNVNNKRLFDNLEILFANNFKVSITCVISIYNVYYIDEFIQFLKDKNYLDKLYGIEILYAFGDLLSPALIPDDAKQELLTKLKQDQESELFKNTYSRFPSFKSAIAGLENYINNNSKSYTFERFIITTETFDKEYKKNVADVFPWLGDVIDNYKNNNSN